MCMIQEVPKTNFKWENYVCVSQEITTNLIESMYFYISHLYIGSPPEYQKMNMDTTTSIYLQQQ